VARRVPSPRAHSAVMTMVVAVAVVPAVVAVVLLPVCCGGVCACRPVKSAASE
jgi:hypothetical protein